MSTQTLASISIAARAILNMHSLNNEGGEGNQIQTRMVDILDELGNLHNVNAISGDMLKHVLMEHFYRLARDQKMPLCQSCRRFDTNRINADDSFIQLAKDGKTTDAELLNQMIQTCAIDDVAGILVTEGRSLPRKSVVEFGWVLGVPEKVRTNSYFHVKYAAERSSERRSSDADAQKTGANLGQSIFHRPASSGIYAIVCHLELARIGYNDIKQDYAIDAPDRKARAALLLESLLYTFIELNGAMRSTQLPHLVALEGVITTSSSTTPAPLISPLSAGNGDVEESRVQYRAQVENIVSALNGKEGKGVAMHPFDNINAFATEMRDLLDTCQPAQLAVG
jgi:CRISPR-associated protein Cst2